jgi:Zn-dependent protease
MNFSPFLKPPQPPSSPWERRRAPVGNPPVSINFYLMLALFAGSGAALYQGMLPGSPLVFVFVITGWFISLCLHEYGHARMAFTGGDRSVALRGYLRLDPFEYLDPLNSIIWPLVVAVLGGIGLPGAAVYIQPRDLRSKHWESAVSAAGPAVNIVLLLLLAVPFWLGLEYRYGDRGFWGGLGFLALLQMFAVAFNLLPLPGIDGFGIIAPYLPGHIRERMLPFRQFTFLILLVLFFVLPQNGVPQIADAFFGPVYRGLDWLGVPFSWVGYGYGQFRFWRGL